MSSEMMHNARVEFITAVRHRYAAATHKEKHRILDEFVAATGYHVKSAIRVLNGPGEPKRRRIGKRPSLYDEAARGALIVLWEASDRICGKRLKALLPVLLPALERNGHLKLEAEIRAKILSMSAATIDRLLESLDKRRKPRSHLGLFRSPAGVSNCGLCGLERSGARQHGNGPGGALRHGQPRQLHQQRRADQHRQRLDGSDAHFGARGQPGC